MINLRQKRITIKTAIVVMITVIVCVVVSLLFGFLQTNEIRKNYYADIALNANYLKQDIYDIFSRADSSLYAIDAEDIGGVDASHFKNVTNIVFIKRDATATMAAPASVLSNIILKSDALAKIISKTSNPQDGVYRDITTLSNLFVGADSPEPVYISVKSSGDLYIMAVLGILRCLKEIRNYGFDNIRIFASDITYSCSNADSGLTQEFYSKMDNGLRARLLSGEAFTDTVKIDSGKYIVSIASQDEVYKALRVLAAQGTDRLNSQISRQVNLYSTENISIVVIFVACFVLLIVLLVKDEDNFRLLTISNTNYALKVNSAGKIIWQNNNFAVKFKYDNISGCLSAEGKMAAYVLSTGKPVILELDDNDGDRHYLLMSVTRFGRYYRLVGSDLTPEIATYKSLSHADKYDSITDLQLEWVFGNKVASVIARGKGIKGALALMRLSNLPMLKIMLGEHMYKQLLMIYANCLKREFDDLGELYVLKNNDFLLFNIDEKKSALLINKLPAIMEKLRQPVKLNDNVIQLDIKLGAIVLNSSDSNITANSLLSNAQRALEYAVNSVRQNYYILYPTGFSVARTNFRADGVVKMMIDSGEIEAYFQPQYSLSAEKIVGFEALCRIIGPKSSEINIGELIEIAEQYGGMVELGNFICDKAMSFAAEVQEGGIQVAVNVSPIQLMQAGFTASFVDMHKKHNLKKGAFNIEITEGAALYSFDEAVAKLNLIKNCGVGIHIDDFGVAYSSMLHLKLLPATLVKIDKSLVDDITESEDAKSIIKNIINLARDLRLKVIAEGVEKENQLNLLKELGCDMVQGYVISKAVPRLKAKELLIKEGLKDAQ